LDVLPLSIGIKTSSGLVRQLLKRNSTIPTRTSYIFSQDEINYSNDNQLMIIEIYEGERIKARNNHLLGTFELKCSNSLEITQELEVKCDIDANGILTVIAIDLSNGNKNEIQITRDKDCDEINRMVADYERNKESDERERNRILEAHSSKSYENDNIFSIWKRLSSILVSKINNTEENFKLNTCLKHFLKEVICLFKK
jgi:molecular chaperone DnaK (HSP70)